MNDIDPTGAVAQWWATAISRIEPGVVHGGDGEQCVQLLDEIVQRETDGMSLPEAVDESTAARPRYLPRFGHRFHPRDPRRDPLLSLVERSVGDGVVAGHRLRAAQALEAALARNRAKPVPMNIDGATAVVYAELGFPAPLASGLFVLSRSVGIFAHAWEETQSGKRNKGPIPREITPAHVTGRQ